MEKERLEERKIQEAALKAELDAITLSLESVKRVHANLENTYGMSHNTARYFQKTDEDYANLRRKLNEFSHVRSKEAEKQLQLKKQLYRYQQQEDKEVEHRRLRDMSRITHANNNKLTNTLNGSLSPRSQTPSSRGISTRNSLSSTIPTSTCSSPLSMDDYLPPNRLSNQNSHSIARTINRHRSTILETQPKRPSIDFSFYKGPPQDNRETLEVTDINFLETVEDETMLEVNELLNRMQSVLGDCT